jgi:hypothetical protein
MSFSRQITAAQKAVFDFYYDNNYEERISYLEKRMIELLSRRSKTFRFTGIVGSKVDLPYSIIPEVEPIVAINGVIQALGYDYDMVSDNAIKFREDLYLDDVVTANITYMEAT